MLAAAGDPRATCTRSPATRASTALVRTGRTVTACSWDESAASWTVETSEGERYEAEALVLATGQLHQPHVPLIQGAGEFAGHTFHSASWDHDYELEGKRVGVDRHGRERRAVRARDRARVAQMTVFQRTGNWFLPRKNRPYPTLARRAFERVPGLQELPPALRVRVRRVADAA